MSTPPTSSLSTLQRAILRCEMGIDVTKLTNTQLVNFEARTFTTKSRLATFQTSTLESREYIIIPVVACIGNRVAHPTSEANLDELIPAAVLGDIPYQWDGRPIILDHPPLSEDANTPQSYQSRKFGLMFDTSYDFDTNKLTTNAWIDYERAKEVGADYLVDKIVAGDITEVSIGVLRQLLFQKGEHKGQPYQAIWVKMVSDHLAFLHADQIGACAVNDGCGAGRLESGEVNNQEEKSMSEDTGTTNKDSDDKKDRKGFSLGGLFQRFKSVLEAENNTSHISTRSDSESTLQQTKYELYRILFDRIPGLMDVFDILPESSICLFETWRMDSNYEQWAIRYQVTGDVVTIVENEQPIRVMPKTVWVSIESGVAVSAEGGEIGEEATTKANQCGCQASQENVSIITPESEAKPESETIEETISTGELAMSDEKKTEEAKTTTATAPATTTTTPANQSVSAPTSTPADLEAYLSTAPPEIRRIVERDRQNELRTRNSAIESVLANQKREIWTKERLEILDTETLTTLADSLVGEDEIQALPAAQQSNYINHADYSGSRSSYSTSNKPADPRDNSRSLGWGGVKKEAN